MTRRWVGGVFGNTVGSDTDATNLSGVFSIEQQYYIKQEGGWESKLGSSSAFAATSAQAIIDAGHSNGDGFYWIQTSSGMANPVRIWCDMTTQSGVGWMRFWWYGRYEQGAGTPSTNQFVTQDQLGIADISTVAYDSVHGRCRIPSGQTVNGIMVKGNSAPNPIQGTNLPYAIWNTGSGTNTESRVLGAFQSGSVVNAANGNVWTPSITGHISDSDSLSGGGRCDSFYYHDQGSQGYNSFHFDDDTGYCITAFSAGYDGGSTGVDVFDNNNNCDQNSSTGKNLIIYWR